MAIIKRVVIAAMLICTSHGQYRRGTASYVGGPYNSAPAAQENKPASSTGPQDTSHGQYGGDPNQGFYNKEKSGTQAVANAASTTGPQDTSNGQYRNFYGGGPNQGFYNNFPSSQGRGITQAVTKATSDTGSPQETQVETPKTEEKPEDYFRPSFPYFPYNFGNPSHFSGFSGAGLGGGYINNNLTPLDFSPNFGFGNHFPRHNFGHNFGAPNNFGNNFEFSNSAPKSFHYHHEYDDSKPPTKSAENSPTGPNFHQKFDLGPNGFSSSSKSDASSSSQGSGQGQGSAQAKQDARGAGTNNNIDRIPPRDRNRSRPDEWRQN